eukprot:5649333-Pleurochrysis_carterae.AAC.1
MQKFGARYGWAVVLDRAFDVFSLVFIHDWRAFPHSLRGRERARRAREGFLRWVQVNQQTNHDRRSIPKSSMRQ